MTCILMMSKYLTPIILSISVLLFPATGIAAVTVTISEPSTSPTIYVETSTITEISGTASTDSDDPVVEVTFTCSTCDPESAEIYYDIQDGIAYWYVYNVDIDTPGSNTVTVTAESYDGATGSDTITITYGEDDTEDPVITAFVIPSGSESLTVPITTFTATDNEGVTGYYVSSSWPIPDVESSVWESSPQTQYVFDSDGLQTLYAYVKDAAGNTAYSFDMVTIVIELPAGEGDVFPLSYDGNAVNYDGTIINYEDEE